PFTFAGDGAGFAVPAAVRAAVEPALAATRTWAAEEVRFDLRTALVPIADIRAAGRDLKVARFNVTPALGYAMMTGGGLTWAEDQMKAGRYAIAPAPAGSRPDLTGLSCRWMPIDARNGEIASILVMPRGDLPSPAFADLVTAINKLVREELDRSGHPVPASGPRFSWPSPGIDLEASATQGGGSRLARKAHIVIESLLGWVLFKTGLPFRRFEPTVYRRETAQNTDYRKFDDG